jgi:glycosyltransferase involved in cell wall biosynthesis
MPDVIIPVLDEAAALPTVLAGIPAGYRAIVVDNGSTDGSARIASELGAVVVIESVRGFGSACWAGLLAADHNDGVVCFMDGDASLDGADLPTVAGTVLLGSSDLVLGARRPTVAGAWPWHARLANRALAWEIRRRTGYRVCDVGPMRAARRDALLNLDMQDRRFGWPLEMVLRASLAGWRVTEVAVPYRPRVGQSKVTGTARGTARAVRDMAAALR